MKKLFQLSVLTLLISCNSGTKNDADSAQILEPTISKHLERLASDDFLGRKPFTKGETLTVNYF